MRFAVIKDSKVFTIIGLYPTNWKQFDEIVTPNQNVIVGDDYINGKFYRNGMIVLSDEEEYLGIISGEIEVTENDKN